MSQRTTPRRRPTDHDDVDVASSQGRARRRRRDDGNESDHSVPEATSQAQATPGKPNAAERAAGKMSDQEVDRKINDLVRLALFMELKKVSLRREEINKKILGQHTRTFQHVFESAQTRLRDIFGMEMVELPTREKKNAIGAHGAMRRGAAQPKGGSANNAGAPPPPAPTSSKSYAVRNLLPTELRCTNVISMQEEEAADYGLLAVVLSLIYVNSQVLAEKQLLNFLAKLDAPSELDRRLATFVKQGYLDKPKSDLFQGAGSSQNPAGVPGTGFDYVWGPRAKTEWNTDSLASFIGNVYGREDRPKDLKKNIEEAGWTETSVVG